MLWKLLLSHISKLEQPVSGRLLAFKWVQNDPLNTYGFLIIWACSSHFHRSSEKHKDVHQGYDTGIYTVQKSHNKLRSEFFSPRAVFSKICGRQFSYGEQNYFYNIINIIQTQILVAIKWRIGEIFVFN